jgi:hypothetical protein
MQDVLKIGRSTTESIEAQMRIKCDGYAALSLGVAAVRDLVVYAIHHYSTVRNYAFQALVDCGYVEEIPNEKNNDTAR